MWVVEHMFACLAGYRSMKQNASKYFVHCFYCTLCHLITNEPPLFIRLFLFLLCLIQLYRRCFHVVFLVELFLCWFFFESIFVDFQHFTVNSFLCLYVSGIYSLLQFLYIVSSHSFLQSFSVRAALFSVLFSFWWCFVPSKYSCCAHRFHFQFIRRCSVHHISRSCSYWSNKYLNTFSKLTLTWFDCVIDPFLCCYSSVLKTIDSYWSNQKSD